MNRDTRFSKDKSPYKDWVGIHFAHTARKDAPGLHVHLSRGDCGVGLGVWMLEPAELAAVRDGIGAPDGGWAEVRRALDDGGFSFIGDTLKRVPKGWPADHPFADDLRRKTFGAGRPFDPELPLPELCAEIDAAFRQGWPLVGFLCQRLAFPL